MDMSQLRKNGFLFYEQEVKPTLNSIKDEDVFPQI